MEKKYFGSKFYSSTLNTILLFILIILMAIALRFMFQNKDLYLPSLVGNSKCVTKTTADIMSVVNNKDQILGDRDDLVAFSVVPNTKIHGPLSYSGIVKGGYFFEGNILINILDSNKRILKQSNAIAKGEWMTTDPIIFEGNIDFTNLPKGEAFFEIKKDNPGSPSEGIDKSILIPIVIK